MMGFEMSSHKAQYRYVGRMPGQNIKPLKTKTVRLLHTSADMPQRVLIPHVAAISIPTATADNCLTDIWLAVINSCQYTIEGFSPLSCKYFKTERDVTCFMYTQPIVLTNLITRVRQL